MDFVVTKTQSLRLRATFIIFVSFADEDIVKGQKQGNGKFTSVLLAREEIFYRTDVGMWMETYILWEKHEMKSFVQSALPLKRPLKFITLNSCIHSGDLFGYVQCDIKVPDNLK